MVVEPGAGNDANIAFAAWTRLLKFQDYDEAKMVEFIEAYHDQGPERNTP